MDKISSAWDFILGHKKAVISGIILFIIIISVPVGIYLVEHPAIFGSKAAENKKVAQPISKESSKFRGYIVEFKNDPLVEFQTKQKAAGKRFIAEEYKKTLEEEHQNAKKDIFSKISRRSVASGQTTPVILGEYTQTFNGIALDISKEEAEKLKQSSFVKQVYPNLEVKANLDESVPLINADKAWQMKDSQNRNITGQGINIAILDTGVDYTHPDLGASQIQEISFAKVTEPLDVLQTWGGPYTKFITQTFAIDQNRLAYPAQKQIHIYSFIDKSKTAIKLFSPGLEALRLILRDDLLVYYAFNHDYSTSALYYYRLSTKEHKKITDLQYVGTLSISGNKIIYPKKDPIIGSSKIYVYDTDNATEIAITPSSTSYPMLMPKVFGNFVAYYEDINHDQGKILLTDISTGQTQELQLPEPGAVIDFVNNQILYQAAYNNNDPGYNRHTHYLYDLSSNQITKINSASDINNQSIRTLSNYSYISIVDGPAGVITDNIVYFTKGLYGSKIVAYVKQRSNIVPINRFINSYNFDADNNRVCFLTDDARIACHEYDPAYVYQPVIFNNKVISGYNFIDKTNDPFDDNGHGTHVSSIIAGNKILKGVAPEAKLIVYKVLDGVGSGNFADTISALEYIVSTYFDDNPTNNISVINMSIGLNCRGYSGGYTYECGPDDPLSQAVDNTVDAGITVVVAAGNSGSAGVGTINSPATARKAITVGAVDKTKRIASFSSRGPVIWNNETINKPDVVAPGVSICAAQWDSYSSVARCRDDKHIVLEGTSMAAPHVAGLVALIKQAHPDWAPEQIKQVLKNSAKNLGYDVNTQGSGLIDALAVLSFPPPTPTPAIKIKLCAQVITPANNPATGECKDFPTPCDVPVAWVKVSSCPAPSPSSAQASKSSPTPFTCTPCAADINKDGIVNQPDFNLLQKCYTKTSTSPDWNGCLNADINQDNKVAGSDFICLRNQMNKKCP